MKRRIPFDLRLATTTHGHWCAMAGTSLIYQGRTDRLPQHAKLTLNHTTLHTLLRTIK